MGVGGCQKRDRPATPRSTHFSALLYKSEKWSAELGSDYFTHIHTQRRSPRSSGNPASSDRYYKKICLSGLSSLSGKSFFFSCPWQQQKVQGRWNARKILLNLDCFEEFGVMLCSLALALGISCSLQHIQN